jgi:site-specific DNA-methyltransferase (adenine-specific)
MLEINRIYNEDCLEGMKKIDDGSVDLVVTDPPYRTTARGTHGNSGGMLKDKLTRQGKIFKYNDITPKEYIPELYRILKDGSHCYIMTNNVNLVNMLNTAIECGFHFVKSLVWNKGNKIMGHSYMGQFEYILFFRKGKFKKINNCGTSDIISVKSNKSKGVDGRNLHDTEKPVELMKILIENSSEQGETVFDPFTGLGTTPVVAIDTNRNFIGFELDKDYFDIANERINATTMSTPSTHQCTKTEV